MFTSIGKLKDYILCAFTLGANPQAKLSILWKETKNIRVRLKLARHQPDKIYRLQTIYGPLYFRDNFGDITNLVNLFYKQIYSFRRLWDKGVILDIGANIGLAAVWFAHYNPDRIIYCFEPIANNIELIRLNCPNARIEEVALGSQRGQLEFQVDADNVMASQLRNPWKTEERQFNVMSLDEYVRNKEIQEVALMKIDVEGMEGEVLSGSQQTLRKTYSVVMETHSKHLHSLAIETLNQSGFHIDSNRFEGATGMVFASKRNISDSGIG